MLAAAIRLIDLGFFRPGGEEYAAGNGSYGLATIRREQVRCSRNGEIGFDYIGKSGKQQEQAVVDSDVFSVVRSLKRRRSRGSEDLLVYRSGKRWHNVTAGDINDYLREISGDDYTAKDFRTWHATVLAAVGLAVSVQAARHRRPPQARHRPGRQGGGQLPRQHLGRSARLLHRPAGHNARYEKGVTIASALPDLGKGQELATPPQAAPNAPSSTGLQRDGKRHGGEHGRVPGAEVLGGVVVLRRSRADSR